jgi:iron complex outermembrane receptor protein
MRNIAFSNGAKLYLEGYLSRDEHYVHSGKDILQTGYFGAQNVSLSRSGEAPLWLKNYSLAMTFKYNGFTLKARDLYYKHGHAFGLSYILPQKEDFYRLPMRYVEASYKMEPVKDWEVEIKAGVKFSGFYSQSHLAPKGIWYFDSPCPGATWQEHPEGIYGIYEAKQRSKYAGLKLFHHLTRHEIRYGFYVQKDETFSVTSKRTDPSGRLIDYSDTCPFTLPGAERTSKIVYFFDEFHYSDALSFSFGFNFEKNENTDGEFNPRIAVVYTASRDKIFKFSYSRSHRNPSWQELFVINNYSRRGNPNLRPEVVHAVEGSYIKRFGMDDYLQTSLFYLKNENVIDNVNDEHQFRNRSDVKLYGFELELKKALSETVTFYGNYSYVDGRCSCHKPLPNIAHHMAKLYLLKQLSDWSALSISYIYIGERDRAKEDERTKLDATNRVDLALDLRFSESAKLTFALKNLLNEKIRYPSPPNTYENDYTAMDGSSVTATLKWSF